MKNINKDFELFARSRGINSNTLNDYNNHVFKGGYINPQIIEERQLNVATMDVFSRLMYDRIVYFGNEVNSDTANIVSAQLLYLDSVSHSDINLYINSPGGSCTDGLMLCDVMNMINSDVATTNMGMAASMGSVILSCGEKGKRSALPHSRVLIHQPMGGVAPGTTCADFLIEAEQIKKMKQELFEILAENCGKTVDEIIKDADRDFWMTAQEALDYGIIDNIIKKK